MANKNTDNRPVRAPAEKRAAVRRPTSEQLQRELNRLEKKRGLPVALRVILFLIVVLTVAAITFFCLLSGYLIYGSSMSPSLEENDLVLAIPNAKLQSGDIVAFRHEERILVKRIVAGPGDSIEVLSDGHVRRNGSDLYEPYALYADGSTNDTNYPLTVSDGSWFVLGDNRGSSVDSRSSILGQIGDDQMLGKVFIRIWPLTRFELFDRNFFPELIDALKPQ